MTVWRVHPEAEPEEVRFVPRYMDDSDTDLEETAWEQIESMKQAIWALLGVGSRYRPEGAQFRMLTPGERLVLTVEDGVVVGKLEN